jgi:ABC-type transport system substrate-binding protein
MNKRIFPILILILALMLPVCVSATETAGQEKRIEGYYEIETLPGSWNPTAELTPEAELLLSLTADRLYLLSADGKELTASLAAGLPADVTAEFAGSYGIPATAERGYAFRIMPESTARWEDGAAVTAEDLVFTLNQLIDLQQLELPLANLEAFRSGAEKPSGDVISLREGGFSSVEAAEGAGYTGFYVDTGKFWGLDTGWVSIHDRTRLKDAAIPSGITEMYISGAYLYDRYLRSGASLSHYQDDFIGICPSSDLVRREDIGLICETGSFLLILQTPTTAEALALELAAVIPLRQDMYAANYATSSTTYCSSGPWRIASVTAEAVELVPNEYYHGKNAVIEADRIYLKMIGT